jgi:ABC-2 type transport system permease protein
MNPRVLLAFVKKELSQTLRDPRMRTLLFIAPLIQLTLFGLALRTEVRNIKLGVVAAPGDRLAWELAERAVGTGWFQRVDLKGREPFEALRAGAVDAVLIAPPGGLTRAAGRGRGVAQVLVDGSNSVRAQGVYQYLDQIRQQLLQDTLLPQGSPAPPQLALRARVLYNPTLESRTFMVPGVLAMLLVLAGLTLVSSSIAREKERGTFETLLASPISRVDILLGKCLPYVALGIVQLHLVLAVAYFGFKVPFRGSYWELLVAGLAFIMATVSLGVLVSTFARSQQQSMMGGFLILYPAQMLSGILYPLENMPAFLRWITYFNPLRYFAVLIRNILLKGGSSELFWPNVGGLFLLSFCLFVLAWRRFSTTLN